MTQRFLYIALQQFRPSGNRREGGAQLVRKPGEELVFDRIALFRFAARGLLAQEQLITSGFGVSSGRFIAHHFNETVDLTVVAAECGEHAAPPELRAIPALMPSF